MAKEIELKYLLWKDGKAYHTKTFSMLFGSLEKVKEHVSENGQNIFQGYLPIKRGLELAEKLEITVDFEPVEARLRLITHDIWDFTRYFTLKSAGDVERTEIETIIPYNHRPDCFLPGLCDCDDLFHKYRPLTEGKRINKRRAIFPFMGLNLEVDVYSDRDLIVAEIELPQFRKDEIIIPLGKNITNIKKYKNKNLAK